MNFPSEVVIIAGDSRFDQAANRMERLQAFELLNAAGRAGRAGEASQGFVLIIPSKVIDFDNSRSQIHSHWSDLQSIFAQSDQCLEIEDPFVQLLDQIHVATAVSEAARYFLSRLPRDPSSGSDESARNFLARSLGAYRAKLRSDDDWIVSRTEVALKLRNQDPSITHTWIDQVAASAGIPVGVLTRLVQHLTATAGSTPATMVGWRNWLLAWLGANAGDVSSLFRQEGLEGLFGSKFKSLKTPEEKGIFAISYFEQLLPRWMAGDPLATIELAFGTPTERLGKCEKAREFVLRLVPELAYLYALLPELYRSLFPTNNLPVALVSIGAAVREGFDLPEKVALRSVLTGRPNRRAVHTEYERVARLLSSESPYESFSDLRNRLELARQFLDS